MTAPLARLAFKNIDTTEETAMHVEPYLFFDGRCEEALQFYGKAIGAETGALMRFRESPEPAPPGSVPAGFEDKVMHATLRIGDTTLMASDGNCANTPRFEGFALSLTAPDTAKAEQWFTALADGGKITMPLNKTFFAESFGMVTDRFGVNWMVIVHAK